MYGPKWFKSDSATIPRTEKFAVFSHCFGLDPLPAPERNLKKGQKPTFLWGNSVVADAIRLGAPDGLNIRSQGLFVPQTFFNWLALGVIGVPMANGSVLSILHISDFHFTKRKSREQGIVVDALIKDLEELCIGHRRPDVVIFSGDLVNAGGVDSHDDAYDFLLSRVAQATGCSDERIFIVPGNHDLSRDVVTETSEQHRAWRSIANDMDALNTQYEAKEFQETGQRKLAAYQELERYLSEGSLMHRNQFASVYRLDARNIDVVVINTAMLSVGGHEALERDQGLLAVPEYALLEAAGALQKNSFRIYATHHPFEMLSEAGARMLRRSIEEHANVHLFGHMHDPESRNSIGFKGQLFSDQAGAVFTQRKKKYIGYSLISVDRDTNHYETHLRTYFDDRRAFDDAVDVVPQGRFYSSQEARQFWRKIATPVDEKVFRRYLSGPCLATLKAELEQAGTDWDAHERFVPPPLKRTFMQAVVGDEAKSFVETTVAFDEVAADDANVIIYAPAEYGRTTVLKELVYRALADAQVARFPRLPVMVDFSDIRINAGNLLKVVRGRAPDLPEGVDFESLLKLGHVSLLFDDVMFSDMKRMKVLRDFVAAYPKARYVLSSVKSSAAPYGAHVNPEMPIHFEFVELCVLRRKDMRQLIVKFHSCTDVESVLDRLQSEFQEINLPFTAANGSILMSIYEEQSGFRPINRSVLIEQFIDTTLRKAAVEQSRRETFDYANKTALLAHVAAWMAKADDYAPPSEAVRGVMKEYLDGLGLNAPLDDLMAEFLLARIFLKRPDNRLSFRYRAVLEYFIALQMSSDAAFKAWVMEEERYLQFVNEIQYYAGKLRNDSELLDEIGRRFEETIAEIQAQDRPLDLTEIQSLTLPGKNSELADDLLNRHLEEPLSQEERDAELEADLPEDVEKRQEVFRPQIEDPGQKLLVSLILYSGVVKNMELVDDARKRRHLAALWRGWSIFWLLSLMIVPEIARQRRFRLNGVLYDLSAPQGMSDAELARVISLNMPTGLSTMISAALGTEKLERQLVEPRLESATEPLSFEFLRTALIADLKLSATPGSIKAAFERFRFNPYLSEALVWKIAELRRMDRITLPHMEAIKSTLAGAIADLKGGSKRMRLAEKRNQVDRLQREKLMLKIKRQQEGD